VWQRSLTILHPSKIKNVDITVAKQASPESTALGQRLAWRAHVFPARERFIRVPRFNFTSLKKPPSLVATLVFAGPFTSIVTCRDRYRAKSAEGKVRHPFFDADSRSTFLPWKIELAEA
jgi:hypothetical protein